MISIVIGTRAELIKMFPIMKELSSQNKEYVFIHTGQHNLIDLCKSFKIKEPDVILSKQPDKSSKFFSNKLKALFWNFSMIIKIRSELKKIKDLDYVLYHGDTMTTASVAMASSRLLNPFKKYKNVHVEAGLRSRSIFEPFPEELARKFADSFSDLNLSPSKLAAKNIKRAIVVGNTVVDSVDYSLKLKKVKISEKNYAVCTVHRHENISSEKRLKNIVDILNLVNIPLLFFLHDNTRKQLKKYGLFEKLNDNIKILKNTLYFEFIHYLKKCTYLLTDGGSIQEESLVFKKPCLLLRDRTERPEGLETGINFLTKLDVDYSKKIIADIEKGNLKIKEFKNPYGEKGVSKKIVGLLK
jgi:UDP-N-acetylglucosamine 2-epimerase (non-hydrolysing)